jgi:multiple antibiotic resistance protein
MDSNIALIIQIFALINPLASFPFLISAYEKKMNVKIIAVKSVLVAFVLAILITLIGPSLFTIFGITLDSFRIAGGIVLLLLGIDMVRPKEEEHKVGKINSLIAIIATPLLTGPATISFITIKAFELGKMHVLYNVCIAFVLVAIVFILFSFLISKINTTVVDIASRIMGLFLTAVSIEMIASGIQGIFHIAI